MPIAYAPTAPPSTGDLPELARWIYEELLRLRSEIDELTLTGGGGGGDVSVLDDLDDVVIASALNDQVLQYDGTYWRNETLPFAAQITAIDARVTVLESAITVLQADLAALQDVVEGVEIACSDETTALASSATAVRTFRWIGAADIYAIRASLTTAQTSGAVVTVNVKINGTTVFITKITLDNTEKTSTTAATASVLTNTPTPIADNDEVTIFIDQVGDGTAKGLKVQFVTQATA